MENVKLLKSPRNSLEMLAYENYIYSKGYETTNHINVYCTKRTAKGCMARGKFLKLSGRIILTVQHNHEAIEAEPEAKCRMVRFAFF